jgi:hypothetical protein
MEPWGSPASNSFLYLNGGKIDCLSDFIRDTDVTVATWVKFNTYGSGGVGGRIIDNGSFMIYTADEENSAIRVTSDNQSTYAIGDDGDIPLNEWHHVCVTRTFGGVVNIYIDGVLSGDADQNSGIPVVGTSNVIIGNRADSERPLNGYLDKLFIFNRILSLYEIEQIKESTADLTQYDPSLLLDLKLSQTDVVHGAELITNGDFSSWNDAADPNNTPTGWTVIGRDESNYVTKSSNACRFIADGTTGLYAYQPSILTEGKSYRYSLNVTDIAVGSLKLTRYLGGQNIVESLPEGVTTGIYPTPADITSIAIQRVAACDVTVDDFSIREYYLHDCSVNNRKAYPQTTPTWVELPSGLTVLDFDGSSDALNLGSDFIGTGARSLEFWMYLDGWGENDGGVILSNGNYYVNVSNSKVVGFSSVAYTDGIGIFSAIDAVSLESWYHVAITRDSDGTANIYINGVLSESDPANHVSGDPAAGITDVFIGDRSSGSRAFDGKLSGIRVYNTIPNPSFWLTRYNNTVGYYQTEDYSIPDISKSGLLAWYKIDEGVGTTLKDSSRNNRTATLSAATWTKYKAVPPTPTQNHLIDTFSVNTVSNLNNITKTITGSHAVGGSGMSHTNGIIELDDNLTLSTDGSVVTVSAGKCVVNGSLIEIQENVVLDPAAPSDSFLFNSAGDSLQSSGTVTFYIAVYYSPTEEDPNAYVGFIRDNYYYTNYATKLCIIGFARITKSDETVTVVSVMYSSDARSANRDLFGAFYEIDGNDTTIQVRRATEAQIANTMISRGEIYHATDTNNLYIGDGGTLGGFLIGEDEDVNTSWEYDPLGDVQSKA